MSRCSKSSSREQVSLQEVQSFCAIHAVKLLTSLQKHTPSPVGRQRYPPSHLNTDYEIRRRDCLSVKICEKFSKSKRFPSEEHFVSRFWRELRPRSRLPRSDRDNTSPERGTPLTQEFRSIANSSPRKSEAHAVTFREPLVGNAMELRENSFVMEPAVNHHLVHKSLLRRRVPRNSSVGSMGDWLISRRRSNAKQTPDERVPDSISTSSSQYSPWFNNFGVLPCRGKRFMAVEECNPVQLRIITEGSHAVSCAELIEDLHASYRSPYSFDDVDERSVFFGPGDNNSIGFNKDKVTLSSKRIGEELVHHAEFSSEFSPSLDMAGTEEAKFDSCHCPSQEDAELATIISVSTMTPSETCEEKEQHSRKPIYPRCQGSVDDALENSAFVSIQRKEHFAVADDNLYEPKLSRTCVGRPSKCRRPCVPYESPPFLWTSAVSVQLDCLKSEQTA